MAEPRLPRLSAASAAPARRAGAGGARALAKGYRGRFAPSPTGRLHLGLARTALLGWLRARACGGAFVLRIEDLDAPRAMEGAAQALLEDLRWLGLDWDEGPDVSGPFGPYVQSERLARYDAAIEALRARGRVYPCTCTRSEIAVASAPHGPAEYGPRYPGTCRARSCRADRPASLRFLSPEPLPSWIDAFRPQPLDGAAEGDFVVRRADGVHSYQLAVVVDDAAMQISEVVRGDDLRGCTPWQLALYAALDLPAPAFCHVPLLLDADGRRLAKRNGALALAAYREAGCAPERLVGWLAASCGLVSPGTRVTARSLLADFGLERIDPVPGAVGREDLPPVA